MINSKINFLKDVLHCSLVAYGGPEAHYGVFIDILVKKKKYLTEEELLELMALTNFLPGPSSTQTIVAIGYKIGGILLSILTFLIWLLPALILMILLSFSANLLLNFGLNISIFKYLTPMALGFIIFASYSIYRKVITNKFALILSLFSAMTIYFFQYSFMYVVLIILGAIFSVVKTKTYKISIKDKIKPNWSLLATFVILSVIMALLPNIFKYKIIDIISSFYHYGYLVIGGGNVVIPMMFTELVEIKNYISQEEFLNGFGLVQAIPGPMFSFSAYIGSIAFSGENIFLRILLSVTSGVIIFLPGLILIYFVYPIWNNLKNIEIVKSSINGIIAVTSGFIFITPLLIIQKNNLDFNNIIISLVVFVLLYFRKIPTVLIVILTILCGTLF